MPTVSTQCWSPVFFIPMRGITYHQLSTNYLIIKSFHQSQSPKYPRGRSLWRVVWPGFAGTDRGRAGAGAAGRWWLMMVPENDLMMVYDC